MQILPLALIHELILIYPYLTHNELKTVYRHCLSKNFKKVTFDRDEMNYILSLLVVSKYIKKKACWKFLWLCKFKAYKFF